MKGTAAALEPVPPFPLLTNSGGHYAASVKRGGVLPSRETPAHGGTLRLLGGAGGQHAQPLDLEESALVPAAGVASRAHGTARELWDVRASQAELKATATWSNA